MRKTEVHTPHDPLCRANLDVIYFNIPDARFHTVFEDHKYNY